GAFRSTDSLALDRAGNLYVVDNQSCTVSRIAPDGTVAVIAGQAGQRGSMDGVGAAARFDSPSSVSAEADGTLYVADRSNCTIRKITPSGIVTTLAGLAGSAGLANGQGADARFWYAAGVAADGQGRVYVADSGADRIRVIAADGTVSYVAGAVLSKGYSMSGSVDGTGPNALFNHPTNLVVAPSGDIFVADTGNATIRKVTAAGVVTTFAGRASMGTADGAGADAQFQHLRGLALDAAGNAYVADQQSNTIRQITPAGVVSTFAGVADGSVAAFDGPRQMARFYWPAGVAVDRGGHVYVADTMNNLIRIIDRDGWVSTLAGKAFALAKPGSANEGIGGLNPGGSADGVGAEAEFYGPTGIAVDRAGFVYVADQGNHTIRRISPEGKVTTLAGLARTHGSADGVGAAARFNWPSGVAVDAHGNVFVADTMNNAIRKITPDGIVSTIAGKVGLWSGDGSPTTAWGSADGGGGRARFNTPAGVAVDDYGNLYVADRGNSLLRLIQPSGVVTTLAGCAGFNGLGAGESGSSGSVDALGVAARLNLPTGIAVTQSGTVYFTDSGNRTVRVGAPATPPRLAPVIAELIASEANTIGSRADLSVNVIGTPAPSIQWHHNGTALIPGNQPQLSLPGFQPSNAGIYTAVATNAAGTIDSGPSIVGVSTTDKVAGSGTVLGTDIRHPNGRRFDQVLLTGVAEAITASPGHVTRTSFIDDNDDIVQVEFSGPGTLSLVLANAFAPATPVNYTQPIKYMKGHAGIVITGATGQTHVSVFTVGRATAVDPTGAFDILQSPGPDNDPARNGSSLFEGRSQTRYDGKADIAFIAISSADGHFGGIRTSNAFYSASRGITGVYAPGVVIDGPLFIGNIRGSGSATAMIVVGSVQDARITGGDLLQTNNMPVQVEGLTTLRSTAGGDSHGNVLPARPIVGLLATGKRSVNDLLVVNP
ncbi:MAG TPA: immunoglobulin domain-containing protein, partial [Opitutus sp.]|nr:immunoglobulin domain-containing protein [Opitutus sp.]